MLARVLVVDDDPVVVAYLIEALAPRYAVIGETSPRAALDRIAREDVDVMVSDVEMPGLRGLELLAGVLERKPRQAILLMSAFGSIELAVEAVRAGACDFVTKPFRLETLVVAIERALRERSMRREIVRLRRRLGEDDDPRLVARSAAMRRVLDVAHRAARADATVLVTGPSGAGKGVLARWIHEHGARRDGPLVHVNCAALPANLIEAELFGVRRGAFTDARESRDGLFVEASRGTLFLDEIGELPLAAQAKLLYVLESGRVRPVGAGAEVDVDVRLIAATNRDLGEAVLAGRFRHDLFFRLHVIPIAVPPLAARRDDIPELAQLFLARAQRGAPGEMGITDEALRWLCQHEWPGNVRELSNVIERAVALTDHDTIVLEDVRDLGAVSGPDELLLAEAVARQVPLAEVELAYIRQVIAIAGGNMTRAARVLGIDRRTLSRRLTGSR